MTSHVLILFRCHPGDSAILPSSVSAILTRVFSKRHPTSAPHFRSPDPGPSVFVQHLLEQEFAHGPLAAREWGYITRSFLSSLGTTLGDESVLVEQLRVAKLAHEPHPAASSLDCKMQSIFVFILIVERQGEIYSPDTLSSLVKETPC